VADDLARAVAIHSGMISAEALVAYLADDCFLTLRSASKFIDYADTRMLERAVRNGQLPAFRVARKTLVRKSDLVEWVLRQRLPYKSQAKKDALADFVSRAVERARMETAANEDPSQATIQRWRRSNGSR
jgi:hypothetical protein